MDAGSYECGVAANHFPLVLAVFAFVAILHQHVRSGIVGTPAAHSAHHLGVAAEVGVEGVAYKPCRSGRAVPLHLEQAFDIVVVAVLEEVVVILHQGGAAVLYNVEAHFLAEVEVGLVAVGLTPAGTAQIGLGKHSLGTPTGSTAGGGRAVRQMLGSEFEVADYELKHVLLIVAGAHGVVNHVLVVFKKNHRAPDVYCVVVRAGSHKACFGNGAFLGAFAYFGCAFGVDIGYCGVCHGHHGEQSLPSLGDQLVKSVDSEEGELRVVVRRVYVVGAKAAHRNDGALVVIEPCAVVERGGGGSHGFVRGVEVVLNVLVVWYLVEEVASARGAEQ